MRKKQVKNVLKKVQRTLKRIKVFLNQIYKNYESMKKAIKSIWLLSVAIIICSCGSTKVLVDKPSTGTSTTITVTTNNPISTEVNPNVELKNDMTK